MMSLRKSSAMAVLSLVMLGTGACTIPEEMDSQGLTGTLWELQQIQFNDGTLLLADPPQNYTAQFFEDGVITVQADCNRALGEFTDDTGEQRLSISMGPTTLAACPPGSISSDYLQALGNANLYFFQDDDLFVDLKFDSGTMQFSPADHPPLLGTVWQLQQIQYNDGTLLIADPPENYTVEFSREGEIFVQADCNRATGQFSEQGEGRLSITTGASTLAACPPESISDDFLRALNNANIAFFQDDSLFIDLKFDSGTMQFLPLN